MAVGSLLVVEDDALVSWAFEKAAAAARVLVRVAATAAEALAALREQPCDLAIVDIRLPDGDGIELMPAMAALSPAMRFVVVTADASAANRERAFRYGAWHFIEKPFEMAEVRRVIEDCFALQPSRRHHERRECRHALRLDVLPRADALAPSVEGFAVDVSHAGLRLETRYPLAPGQELRVHPVPGAAGLDDAVRDAVARVVWARNDDGAITAGLVYVSL